MQRVERGFAKRSGAEGECKGSPEYHGAKLERPRGVTRSGSGRFLGAGLDGQIPWLGVRMTVHGFAAVAVARDDKSGRYEEMPLQRRPSILDGWFGRA